MPAPLHDLTAPDPDRILIAPFSAHEQGVFVWVGLPSPLRAQDHPWEWQPTDKQGILVFGVLGWNNVTGHAAL